MSKVNLVFPTIQGFGRSMTANKAWTQGGGRGDIGILDFFPVINSIGDREPKICIMGIANAPPLLNSPVTFIRWATRDAFAVNTVPEGELYRFSPRVGGDAYLYTLQSANMIRSFLPAPRSIANKES